MANNNVNGNIDPEIDAIITELEQSWFAESEWQKTCYEFTQSASAGCGLSYDVFVQKFSDSIDFRIQKLNTNHHEKAIEIARSYGYATPEEIEKSKALYDDMGVCTHGIDLGCCPAGCE